MLRYLKVLAEYIVLALDLELKILGRPLPVPPSAPHYTP